MKQYIMMILILTLVIIMCRPEGEVLLLDESNHSQTFYMTKGDEVVISLESNPTTGYKWEIVAIDTQVIVEKQRSDYVSQSKRLGASGTQRFYLIASDAGNSELALEYRRSWEREVQPIKRYSVKIHVR
ncbi:protease inhibitor I42 family protein [candidate division KSB1 bacterium]|nr:protease inhibitor I42 family protein [candidate division KSB1 bacterium]